MITSSFVSVTGHHSFKDDETLSAWVDQIRAALRGLVDDVTVGITDIFKIEEYDDEDSVL